jgi:hypothetical protein
MKSQKIKLTSRKFYGKWLYKISLRQVGCAIFRNYKFDYIKELCQGDIDAVRPYSVHQKAYTNRENILRLCETLEKYDPKIWTKRIENSNLDLYTNNFEFYQKLSEEFQDIVVHQFEPDPATVDLLTNSASAVAVKKLPHDRYQYRVYLLPHKMAGDREGKQRYVDWLKNQGDRVTCTPAVENWFIKTDWNWDRRYILVENESTLLMLKLRNSEVVGRIYNYILSDK